MIGRGWQVPAGQPSVTRMRDYKSCLRLWPLRCTHFQRSSQSGRFGNAALTQVVVTAQCPSSGSDARAVATVTMDAVSLGFAHPNAAWQLTEYSLQVRAACCDVMQ